MESKGFKLNMTKTEYLKCKFSDMMYETSMEGNREFNEDVLTIHMCIMDEMEDRIQSLFYKLMVRPTMLYGTKCWSVKNSHIQKMKVVKMRIL
ncbi:hypothetical protein H5410_050256 [Solanum commersonii]|uniref:Reverse transcriptase n=1 Tax=Solanum commersonii TaxID=4109 RepID=A0A9J5WWI1_SOLCO|nr:hypothetical protein H5410_050256 [Solanum commersonii]